MHFPASEVEDQTPIAGVLDRNIHAIINSRKDEEKKIGWQDRIAQTITGFIGSMRFVFLHLFVFGGWIFANIGPIRAWRNCSVLDILVSMEAIFLSTFVLIKQNRMARLDARRADLNLQVSLLAEHEITHLVTLITAIASKMNLEHAKNPVLNELKQEIKPEQILEEIEIRQEKADEKEKNET
jgi:uncharacterized membrane protein